MKEVIGTFAALAVLPGFVLYLRGVIRGSTKPHAFSWLVWSLLSGIAFAAQVTKDGGAGSWVSGVVCIGTLAVFVSALFRGESRIARVDWACLVGALLAIGAWMVAEDPLLAVILITVTDALGSFPTFRKAFHRPFEESAFLFALDAAAFFAALFALDRVLWETALFPAFIVFADSALVVTILIRRRVSRVLVSSSRITPLSHSAS